MVTINERTTIPLYAALIALPVLFTVAMAIATLSAKVERAEARTMENESEFNVRIEKQDAKIDIQNKLLGEIRDNLIEIKTTLKLQRKEN